jgi:hypothetical protein
MKQLLKRGLSRLIRWALATEERITQPSLGRAYCAAYGGGNSDFGFNDAPAREPATVAPVSKLPEALARYVVVPDFSLPAPRWDAGIVRHCSTALLFKMRQGRELLCFATAEHRLRRLGQCVTSDAIETEARAIAETINRLEPI